MNQNLLHIHIEEVYTVKDDYAGDFWLVFEPAQLLLSIICIARLAHKRARNHPHNQLLQ